MRRLLPLVLACLAIHSRLLAQPQVATFDNQKTCKLEGTVINGKTGRPLPRALVELYSSGQRAVLTDSEGHFAFAGLIQGSFVSIHARKPGFYDQSRVFMSFLVDPKAANRELRLMPEASIFGQVTDRNGEPLEGATLQAFEVTYPEGLRHLSLANTIVTDEDGNFRLTRLRAGRYYLAVKAGMVARRILGLQSANASVTYPAVVYFPSASDLAGAMPIDLAAGQKMQAGFSLSRGPAFKLAGVVNGVSMFKEMNTPTLVDDSQDALFTANRWNKPDFEFSMVPAGTYSLAVNGVGNDGHYLQFRQSVTIDKNLTGFNVNPSQGVTIPVAVRTEFGPNAPPHSCSGNMVDLQGGQVNCSQVAAQITLVSLDSGYMEVTSQPMSKDDPSPRLVDVLPGKYAVRVTPFMGGHVHTLRCGSVDLLREPLVVAAGEQVAPIELVLRDDGGRVKVQVHSDQQPQGRILLLAEFAPYLPPVVLDIDSTGSREYGDLPPGDYKVFAFDSIEGIEYRNPEAMEKYISKSGMVTVTPNGNAVVAVDLIHAEE